MSAAGWNAPFGLIEFEAYATHGQIEVELQFGPEKYVKYVGMTIRLRLHALVAPLQSHKTA